jgi:uncharacterized C2H2 Zn-finger protein
MAKNYKCAVCGRAFVSKKELDAHAKKAHAAEKEGKKQLRLKLSSNLKQNLTA